jgi:hypothetical protein
MYRGSIGDFGSHYPILAGAVAQLIRRAGSAVLEFGSGDWSTPMLHYMCKYAKLDLYTADTDTRWLSRYKEYARGGHRVELALSWHEYYQRRVEGMLDGTRQVLAFVDCAPGEDRRWIIEQLAASDSVLAVVAHDSERDFNSGANYGYEHVVGKFKHVSEFRRFRPYTLIMSNVQKFDIDECDRTWEPPV